MKAELPAHLRNIHQLLQNLEEEARGPACLRAMQRLERDLLPRTAGDSPYLILGIVGPNNAGKSALFNSLIGAEISPSLPTGGATRRLVGAAHPQLLSLLEREPTLQRFPMSRESAASPTEEIHRGEDPACLQVQQASDFPQKLLLIDTPDFDSIHQANRMASESLLAVADLAVAVVTRHTYQNAEVVNFLEAWLAHGRPWMLVYNEAAEESIAREHAQKLAEDVATPPAAVFWAPHDLAVQSGQKPLNPHFLPMDMWAGTSVLSLGEAEWTVADSGNYGLRQVLFDLDEVARVKAKALQASLAQLQDDLHEVAEGLSQRAGRARALLEVAENRAAASGREIAAGAMPGGPFIDAFRGVLDARSNRLSRGWRKGMRKARTVVENLAAKRRKRQSLRQHSQLLAVEKQMLQRSWPHFWEELARDLGPEARHVARERAPAALAEGLNRDLDASQGAAAMARAETALEQRGAALEDFRKSCEELIETAMNARGRDWDLQLATDMVLMLPVATATVVVFTTGGLGADVAVAGGGAMASLVMERFSHLLGSKVTADARRHWTELRGQQIQQNLLQASLAGSLPHLSTIAEQHRRLADDLRSLVYELT
ncbi:MAG: hypothetical protein DWQ01_00245 [Planctomycetota bacterium]|nr:MAG: hypothetical protein DWQ01_00245 [Planctomycetota bacterium]